MTAKMRNEVRVEIRTNYYSVQKLLSSRLLSKSLKFKVYNTHDIM